jgi:hypothetical protein
MVGKKITVIAKGDLGFHPDHGQIVAGRKYTIFEEQFAEQLFHRPKNWTPLWERKKKNTEEDK